MTDPIAITQADRKMAAEFYRNDKRPTYLAHDLLSGSWDHADIIQTLARHRHAHTAPLEARVQELEEALRPFARMGEMADFAFAPALFRDRDGIKELPWRDDDEEVTITYGDLRRARKALEGRGS